MLQCYQQFFSFLFDKYSLFVNSVEDVNTLWGRKPKLNSQPLNPAVSATLIRVSSALWWQSLSMLTLFIATCCSGMCHSCRIRLLCCSADKVTQNQLWKAEQWSYYSQKSCATHFVGHNSRTPSITDGRTMCESSGVDSGSSGQLSWPTFKAKPNEFCRSRNSWCINRWNLKPNLFVIVFHNVPKMRRLTATN